MDAPKFFTVPTFAPKPSNPKQVCTDGLSPKNLAVLKKSDPFLYYSIPAVREARLHLKEVHVLEHSSNSPSQVNSAQPCNVTRKSRLSFECHPDLLIEDEINAFFAITHLEG
ncbi:hypothetical protein ACHAWO_001809 [Cyclotella atomus]|jgi:hypothetical protein|uniref:Uncharacterized protein n=1 Tax=Cyclotella atomus TaxID=382360 RepID=A0ABD3MVE5_9STRA